MRVPRHLVVVFGAVGLAAVSLAACGRTVPVSDAADTSLGTNRATAPTAWAEQPQRTVYEEAGIRLDPPPTNATPAHSFLEAFATCQTDSACPNGGQPTVTLALVSDDQHGDIQSDNKSTKLDIQTRLAWVMKWENQECPVMGPPGRPSISPMTCTVLVLVDAATNKHLETVSVGSAS
jgi:hypothetical protein